MKILLFVLGVFGAAVTARGQIAIGSTKVDTNAVLTLASESKGLLLPRLSFAARDALSKNGNLSSGMFIYNTTSQELNFYNGSQWISFEANGETGNFTSHRHSISVSFGKEQASAFYTDNSGIGHFVQQALDTGVISSASSQHQVVLYNSRTAWVFNVNYAGVGAWKSYHLAGAVSSLTNNDLVVLYRTGTAYGLSQDTAGEPVWMVQATGAGPLVPIASRKQAVLYRSGNAFGFSRSAEGACAWRQSPIRGAVISTKASYNQILLTTDNDAYIFTGDIGGNGIWYDAPVSGMTATIATQD